MLSGERRLVASLEARNDERVALVDEMLQQEIRDAAVQDDGVPVTLVEVIARADGVELVAQSLGFEGVAFEADPQWVRTPGDEREHLSFDLEHQGVGTKRHVLARARLCIQPLAQRIEGRAHMGTFLSSPGSASCRETHVR